MADFEEENNTEEVLSELEKAIARGLKAIGMTAEGYAKDETPVDTGRLRNSITYAIKDDSAYVGTNVEYAPYVEYGTTKTKAHHMLKKAATEHSEEYKSIMADAMKNA